MAAAVMLFKACAPAPEILEYPLFFPAANYRGRPVPAAADGAAAVAEQLRVQEEQRRLEEQAKAAPKPDVQKERFNKINNGKPISAAAAGNLARQLGFAPSQADLAALHAKAGDNINFEQFTTWQREHCIPHKVQDTPNELMRCFKQLDPTGSGVVSRRQVGTLLGKFGDALTPQELTALFQTMGYTGDNIPYEDFVLKLLASEQ